MARLTLEILPEKVDNLWNVTVIATAQEGRQTLSGEEVQFYCDTFERGQPVTTDREGRARGVFTIDSAGPHTVMAKVCGTAYEIREDIELSDPSLEQKKASRLSVHKNGSDGQYTILVQVLAEDGEGVPGKKITFLDTESGNTLCRTGKTDESGTLTRRVNADRYRFVTVNAVGTTLFRRIRLYP